MYKYCMSALDSVVCSLLKSEHVDPRYQIIVHRVEIRVYRVKKFYSLLNPIQYFVGHNSKSLMVDKNLKAGLPDIGPFDRV